jgi:DNA-binding CsgD family transcriptional regulator/GAF domain-containing protein
VAALSDRQYRSVLDLVGEAHDAQGLDELRSFLLPALRRLVPCEYASYNEVMEDGQTPVAIAEPALPQSAREAWARHAATHPLVIYHQRTRDGRPYRLSDLISTRELHMMPLYRELYEPLGVEHQIAFTLPSPPVLTIGIALSGGGRRDFSDEERQMLDLARPHLIQAYRNAQIRERLTGTVAATRAALETRRAAALVADASQRVSLLTERGAEMAARVAGEAVSEGGRLPPALAERLREGGTRSLPLGDGQVLSHVVHTADGASLMLFDTPDGPLSPESLRGLGLTRRESEVLAGLARGRSTAETASDLGISTRTVHKHAQRVHSKLGVRDRAAAVATAWAAVATGEGAAPSVSATRAGA